MADATPSGRQWTIAAGDYSATVVEVGGGLRTFQAGNVDVLDGYGEAEMCDGARGQLLVPWPNRIDRGRYRFAETPWQLAITEPERGCAIHGLVRWSNWDVDDASEDRVRLALRLHAQPGWPYVVDLGIEYELHPRDGLTVSLMATNVGDSDAPYGSGAHPYLTAGTATINSCELEILASTRLTTDERGIPTGRERVDGTPFDFRTARAIGTTAIDTAFTDLDRDGDGRAWVTLSGRDRSVSLWIDSSHPYVEIYTGDELQRRDKRRTGLGVEPMTCPPNAFRTAESVKVLPPGGSVTSRWGIVARS